MDERKKKLKRAVKNYVLDCQDVIATLNWQLNQGKLAIGDDTSFGPDDPEHAKLTQFRDALQAALVQLK